MGLHTLARDLGVAARLGGRALWRRRPGHAPDTAGAEDIHGWRAGLEAWLSSLPAGSVVEHRFVELPATRPPWTDSGLVVRPGDRLTWFAAGRVYLSRLLDIWVPPSFQLWGRVGDVGPIFRGTRATHTFEARAPGPLQLASYFPGEWAHPDGTLGAGVDEYSKVSGGITALVVRWREGVDLSSLLGGSSPAPEPVRAEFNRLQSSTPAPEGWDYLWYLGPGEIYRPCQAPDGGPAIRCETHGDVGILRRPVAVRLEPGTRLDWRWRVERLPADLREDSLPSHDYLSIAAEFDDGQDLTYYWSASLPAGTVYRCPLPTWMDKETHVVVRSGKSDLGRWLEQSRDLHEDYHRIIGGPARSVVRVWLIANSLFLRGHGRCEYAGIELRRADGAAVKVL
ncbi:MAG TPA: DUF3047 domain-containing protein [Steroidobacteraceae bacterium]|nr:DUF3047 domain-containing protein [Steroidobacteraceae bacterium]